jgi:hypothetical protein
MHIFTLFHFSRTNGRLSTTRVPTPLNEHPGAAHDFSPFAARQCLIIFFDPDFVLARSSSKALRSAKCPLRVSERILETRSLTRGIAELRKSIVCPKKYTGRKVTNQQNKPQR